MISNISSFCPFAPQLAGTSQQVRERRFAQIESLDSLLALSPTASSPLQRAGSTASSTRVPSGGNQARSLPLFTLQTEDASAEGQH